MIINLIVNQQSKDIDENQKSIPITYHFSEGLLLFSILGLLQDGLQQQGIFCQSLHWPHQNVYQPQPIAISLSFAPLKK